MNFPRREGVLACRGLSEPAHLAQTMRIGIDAKWYFNGPAGPRSYVRNFVNTLARLDPENEYVIYLNQRDDPLAVEYSAPNVTTKTLAPSTSWLRVFLAFSWVASRDKLDVLYTNNYCPLFCTCKRVVMVYDILFVTHPTFFTPLERLLFKPIRWAARKADKVVTISGYCRDSIAQHYQIAPSKIAAILLGCGGAFKQRASADRLDAVRDQYELPDRYILYVGRLNIRKNLPRLIESFSGIEDHAIELLVVGAADWKRSDLAGAIERSPARARIRFLGHVPDDDLPAIYQLATVFAYVSLAEGFGFPALEAMASGVPTITSNTTSLPEVVGDCALLVDPSDVADMRRAIDRLLASPDLRADLSAKSIERAKAFTWEETVTRTLDVFHSVNRA